MARNSVRNDGKLATWRLHDIYRQLRLDNIMRGDVYVRLPLKCDELEKIMLELLASRDVTPRDVADTFY